MSTKRQQLEAVYARVPELKCLGLCHASCGPIGCSALEARRVFKVAGVNVGLKHMQPKQEVQACPALDADNLCSAYSVRPLICRLYGVVKRLECPHGCQPERWLSDDEAGELLDEAMRIGGWQS